MSKNYFTTVCRRDVEASFNTGAYYDLILQEYLQYQEQVRVSFKEPQFILSYKIITKNILKCRHALKTGECPGDLWSSACEYTLKHIESIQAYPLYGRIMVVSPLMVDIKAILRMLQNKYFPRQV